MAKRTATSDINRDNWDREDEPEDAGTFTKANEDTLKRRIIKVAKRRNPISSANNEEGKPSAFGGFSGFNKAPLPPTPKTFGFLSDLTKPSTTESLKTNGTSENAEDKKLDEYYAKLKGLNESVSEWIKKHVSANPFINLQPVFKDYDKYITELEKMKFESDIEKTVEQRPLSKSLPQFSFGATPTNFWATTAPSTTSYIFGAATTVSSGSTSTLPPVSSFSSTPSFSFGTSSTTSSGKFSFTSSVIKPADEVKSNDQQEEEDEPKIQITQVVEEGSIYSVRCKVFVKKDGSFADHGVGTLYLKPVPDSEKVQLIVRAESNLGRLICNFILSESIPLQRMGKKDVMLVCIPNPETQPPPVPILLRVKSPEDADDLLKTLEKHKK